MTKQGKQIWQGALLAQLTLLLAIGTPAVIHAAHVDSGAAVVKKAPEKHHEKTTMVIYQLRSEDGKIHQDKKVVVKWQKGSDGQLRPNCSEKISKIRFNSIGDYHPTVHHTPAPDLDPDESEIIYHVPYLAQDDQRGLIDAAAVHIKDDQGHKIQTQYFYCTPGQATFTVHPHLADGLVPVNPKSGDVTFTRDKRRWIINQTMIVKHQTQQGQKSDAEGQATPTSDSPATDTKTSTSPTKHEAGQPSSTTDKAPTKTDPGKEQPAKSEADKAPGKSAASQPSDDHGDAGKAGEQADQPSKQAKPATKPAESDQPTTPQEGSQTDHHASARPEETSPVKNPSEAAPASKPADESHEHPADKPTAKPTHEEEPTSMKHDQEPSDDQSQLVSPSAEPQSSSAHEEGTPTKHRKPAKHHHRKPAKPEHHEQADGDDAAADAEVVEGNGAQPLSNRQQSTVPTATTGTEPSEAPTTTSPQTSIVTPKGQSKLPLSEFVDHQGAHHKNDQDVLLDHELTKLGQPMKKKAHHARLPQTGNHGDMLVTLSGFLLGLFSMLFAHRRSH